jgi:cytochrome c oxidase subunit IV
MVMEKFWVFTIAGGVGLAVYYFRWDFLYKIGTGSYFVKKFGLDKTRKYNLYASLICILVGILAAIGMIDLDKKIL